MPWELHRFHSLATVALPGFQSRSSGKERDTETGLDYFGARYYGSTMGRWLSPDWAVDAIPIPYADITDPQTLNLYSYVRNNPTARVDLDGHSIWRTVFGVYVHTKQYFKLIGKTNELNKRATLKAATNLLHKAEEVEKDGKRVIVAESEAARNGMAKSLSSNKKMRGPERHGNYPEHVNPDEGPHSDVHVQTKDATKGAGLLGALGPIFAPYSDAASKEQNSTPGQIGSAAIWDAAKAIDPFFVTDAIEWITGVSPQSAEKPKQ